MPRPKPPNSKLQARKSTCAPFAPAFVLEIWCFEIWNFSGAWGLVLGVSFGGGSKRCARQDFYWVRATPGVRIRGVRTHPRCHPKAGRCCAKRRWRDDPARIRHRVRQRVESFVAENNDRKFLRRTRSVAAATGISPSSRRIFPPIFRGPPAIMTPLSPTSVHSPPRWRVTRERDNHVAGGPKSFCNRPQIVQRKPSVVVVELNARAGATRRHDDCADSRTHELASGPLTCATRISKCCRTFRSLACLSTRSRSCSTPRREFPARESLSCGLERRGATSQKVLLLNYDSEVTVGEGRN